MAAPHKHPSLAGKFVGHKPRKTAALAAVGQSLHGVAPALKAGLVWLTRYAHAVTQARPQALACEHVEASSETVLLPARTESQISDRRGLIRRWSLRLVSDSARAV